MVGEKKRKEGTTGTGGLKSDSIREGGFIINKPTHRNGGRKNRREEVRTDWGRQRKTLSEDPGGKEKGTPVSNLRKVC